VIHHPPPEQAATKTCAHCSVEMAATSPRAEEWYIQSDGPEGVICLCASCARNVLGGDREERQVEHGPDTRPPDMRRQKAPATP
jgi:hypothetical protein